MSPHRDPPRLEWPTRQHAASLAAGEPRLDWRPVPEDSHCKQGSSPNLLFEGDNLDAMKLLHQPGILQKQGVPRLSGKVDLLYLDPPYNTGHGFVFDDRHGSTSGGWADFILPRLIAARPLLAPDARVLASIDDRELPVLRLLMDQVFVDHPYVGTLVWRSRRVVDSRSRSRLSSDHEYVLVYGGPLRGRDIDLSKYQNPDSDPRGPWMSDNMTGLATALQRPNLHYTLQDPKSGIVYDCPPRGWRFDRDTMARKIQERRVLWPASPGGRPRHKRFLAELKHPRTGISSLLELQDSQGGASDLKALLGQSPFDFPKPLALMRKLLEQASEPGSLVLDPFAGSGTTAHALLEANARDGGNRRIVLMEERRPTGVPEWPAIVDLCRARLREAARVVRGENPLFRDQGFQVWRAQQEQPPPAAGPGGDQKARGSADQ